MSEKEIEWVWPIEFEEPGEEGISTVSTPWIKNHERRFYLSQNFRQQCADLWQLTDFNKDTKHFIYGKTRAEAEKSAGKIIVKILAVAIPKSKPTDKL